MVEMIVDVNAMVSVLPAASMTSLFLESSQNQWNAPHGLDFTILPSITTRSLNFGIKPSKVTFAREALKEYSTNTIMGAYRKKYTNPVATRTNGERRCGFIPHTPFQIGL